MQLIYSLPRCVTTQINSWLMPSSHQRFCSHRKSRNQKRTPHRCSLWTDSVRLCSTGQTRSSEEAFNYSNVSVSDHSPVISSMTNQVVHMLKNAFLYPGAKTELKHIFLTCASTVGSACRWRRGIQSAAQPAQVSWDCHSGCLGLTGLTSTTWRSRHNPGPWATTD